jgi:outer membrane protein OmpA-like peptidoglycan-associated protein
MHTQVKDNIATNNNKGGSFFSPAVIQPKLTVNEPGDMYEQEADAMADKVMRMTDRQGLPPFFPPTAGTGISRLVQRKCAACAHEEEQQVQRQKDKEEEMPMVQKKCAACEHEEQEVQRKENGQPVSEDVSTSLNSTKGGGQPLQHETKSWMENRFGADFGGVKIHTGSEAVQLNRDLNAQAFTHGSDIYFNEGKYNPSSDSGKHLLAHELTHVIQQNGPGSGGTVQRACGVADIGPTPLDCNLVPKDPLGARFLFNINCDEFAPGEEARLLTFASAIVPTAGINILGVASQEGPVNFNQALSCRRASAVRDALTARGGIAAARIGRVEAAGPRGAAGDATMRAGALDLVTITSETVLTTPGSRARTTIGVGEQVTLTHSSGDPTTAWATTAGTLSAAVGATTILTAPDTARAVTVTAGGASIRFNVLAPTSVFMERQPGSVVKHNQNFPDSGLLLDVFLLPDNVNFRNVRYRELDVTGVPFPPGGAYSCNTFSGGHCAPAGLGPCPDKEVLDLVVAGKGSKSRLGDCAYSGHCGGSPPFSSGGIFLIIPYEYRVGGGPFRAITSVLQMHTLAGTTLTTIKANASGTTTVGAASAVIPSCP